MGPDEDERAEAQVIQVVSQGLVEHSKRRHHLSVLCYVHGQQSENDNMKPKNISTYQKTKLRFKCKRKPAKHKARSHPTHLRRHWQDTCQRECEANKIRRGAAALKQSPRAHTRKQPMEPEPKAAQDCLHWKAKNRWAL